MKAEWERQEIVLAKRRNGKRTPGSGAGWKKKGDVHEPRILWEAKQTEAASFIVKLSTWRILRRHALLDGKIPAMALRIQGVDLVVVSQEDFDERFPTSER